MDKVKIATELIKIAKEITALKATPEGKSVLNKTKRILKGWSGESFKDLSYSKSSIQFTYSLPRRYDSKLEAIEDWEENGISFRRRMKDNFDSTNGEELFDAITKYYKEEVKKCERLEQKVDRVAGNVFNIAGGVAESSDGYDYYYILLKTTNKSLEAKELVSRSRSSYFPPDAELIEPRGTDLEIYKYEENGKMIGVAFRGRSNKPLWYYRFRNERELEEQIDKTTKSSKRRIEEKEKRKQERKNFKHGIKVGEYLYSSWGYDQTNIDFFEVVGVTDKSVKIREVENKVVGHGKYTVSVIPAKGKYAGPAKTKRVSPNGYVKINSYAVASEWNGKPLEETAPGYGH